MSKIPPESTVYDLYCGTGTLGICAAKIAKQVIGIELSPESVLDARANIALNNLDNVTIFCGDVYKVLTQLRTEKNYPLPDVVIVDPPRVGLDNAALQHLIDLQPSKIVYVSCNPITQAQNISELVGHGFRLTELRAIDQFPQTAHVENIAILTRELNHRDH